jgi:cell division protein FtsN
MPRDYVKTRAKRNEVRSGPPGFVWLLIGVLVGLIIAGVFYLKGQTKPKKVLLPQEKQAIQNVQTAPAPGALSTTPPPAKPKQPPQTQNLQTQFDFYSVLPGKKAIGPGGDEDTTEIQQQNNNMAKNNGAPVSSSQASPDANNGPAGPTAVLPPPVTPAMPPPVSTERKLPPPLTSGKVVSTAPTPPPETSSPVAKQKPKLPPTPTGYIVQVATFGEHSDADQQKAQLALLGFEAKISEIQKNGKTLERVWLGPFTSRDDAQAVQKQLQENMISGKVLKSGS